MNARERANQILIDICVKKKYSNLVLKDSLKGFSDKDKSLITTLVYGTIQNYNYLLYNWKDYIDKPVKKEIEILINMSVYQIIMMDKIPNYAIINDAVEIAKGKYNGSFKNLVNAVLHIVVRNGVKPLEGSKDEKLAIKTSFPLWLIKMWNKQYGEDVCEKICLDALNVPAMMVRVNTLKSSNEEILAYKGFEKADIGDNCLIYHGSSLVNTDMFRHGLLTIQDGASQSVVPYLDLKEDDYVLDMCAAPGSKTSQISAMMHNKGKIVALELHEKRTLLIKHTLRRLGCINVDVKCCDSTDLTPVLDNGLFDKILLDAPCSGYGVFKRKSDIKYHMQSNDMDGIIETQRLLLISAAKALKNDGILVYSTCTLNKKENDNQIQQFLNEHEDFQLIEKKTIFPYEHNCDGFFIAKMKKN